MEHEAIRRNADERGRLITLVAQITETDLHAIVHGEWTVAATLAHMAFWDRFALATLKRWADGQPSRIDVSDWYDDVLNHALLAGSLALEPSMAARLAVEAATAIDGRLSNLGDVDSQRLTEEAARPETDANWLLHRYRHRAEHLDAIEQVLPDR